MERDNDNSPAPNQPADVIRDRNLKASIWRNEGEKGPFYATTLTRSYKGQDGEYRDTHSFIAGDLLRVAELARRAYERSTEMSRDERRDAFKDKRETKPDRLSRGSVKR